MLIKYIINWYNKYMKKRNAPNKKTIKALNEYEAMKENKDREYKTYNSFAEILKDLNMDA